MRIELVEATLSETERSTMRLRELHAMLHNCSRCPLKASRTRVVFGGGAPDAPVMVVTTAPSWFEDFEGKVAANEGGNLMARAAVSAGLELRRDLYVTHLVKCLRPKVKKEDGTEERAPVTDEQVGACRPFLLAQMAAVRPALVVLQGRDANRHLLGDVRTFNKYTGHWRTFTYDKTREALVLSTHNPYGLMGERAALQGEYFDHWRGVAERLHLYGRLRRPDAAVFKGARG